nr:MAG TPA: hypothetical protein [Caudoviricetes sp.]
MGGFSLSPILGSASLSRGGFYSSQIQPKTLQINSKILSLCRLIVNLWKP